MFVSSLVDDCRESNISSADEHRIITENSVAEKCVLGMNGNDPLYKLDWWRHSIQSLLFDVFTVMRCQNRQFTQS